MKYECWQGGLPVDERFDEETVEDDHPERAAKYYARTHDEGEDGCTVFVLDGDEVHEFDISFRRDVYAEVNKSKAHPIPEPENDE